MQFSAPGIIRLLVRLPTVHGHLIIPSNLNFRRKNVYRHKEGRGWCAYTSCVDRNDDEKIHRPARMHGNIRVRSGPCLRDTFENNSINSTKVWYEKHGIGKHRKRFEFQRCRIKKNKDAFLHSQYKDVVQRRFQKQDKRLPSQKLGFSKYSILFFF